MAKKPVKSDAEKTALFKDHASKRTSAAINRINSLAGLASTKRYKYTASQIDQIHGALVQAANLVKTTLGSALAGKEVKKPSSFKLTD